MCCSSGVCGPGIDPKLVQFKADLDWLGKQGITVERFNMSTHPGVFAQEDVVKQALKEDVNCLPLVVVEGAIICKKGYPSRAEMVRVCRINGGAESGQEAARPGKEMASCGPGCSCDTSSGIEKVKVVATAVALLAIVGIVGYKAIAGGQQPATGTVVGNDQGFAVAAAAQNAPAASKASTEEITGEPAAMDAASGQKAPGATQAGAAVPAIAKGSTFGDSLVSMNELNKVAMDQDAVFILIPAKGTPAADDSLKSSTRAAKKASKTLESRDITVGMYMLNADSADYPMISSQVQTPAILVACKGRGMTAVSGDMSEEKLLQAFISASSAGGGCCPGGAGATGCR